MKLFYIFPYEEQCINQLALDYNSQTHQTPTMLDADEAIEEASSTSESLDGDESCAAGTGESWSLLPFVCTGSDDELGGCFRESEFSFRLLSSILENIQMVYQKFSLSV